MTGVAVLRRGIRRHGPLLAVAAAVLAANAPALLGLVAADPLITRSGLAVVEHAPLIGGSPSIDPNDGYTALALEHLAAQDWVHGHLPWWNPHEGVGAPLLAEMQSAALFPFIFLTLLPRGLIVQHAVLEIVAGLGTYALLRQLGLSRRVACAGGIAFALNGTFAWLGNAVVNPIAFLPLALLGVERTLTGARRGPAILVSALLLSLLAGFPEVAALNGLLVAVWAVARLRGGAARARTSALRLLGCALLAVLLSAPCWLPFVRYLPVADVGGHTPAGTTESLANSGLATFGAPYLFGPIFSPGGAGAGAFWASIGGYTGCAVVVLAAVGLVAGRLPRPLRLGLAGWVTVLLLRTYGFGPVTDLFTRVPGLRVVAVDRYAASSVELALVVLAAAGLAELLAPGPAARRLRLGAALGVALPGGALAAGAGLAEAAGPSLADDVLQAASAVTVCLVAVLLTLAVTVRSRLPAVLLGVVLVVEGIAEFALPQLSAPRRAHLDTGPVDALRAGLGDQRVYTLGALSPNFGSLLGVSQIDVNDLPVPDAWSTLVQSQLWPGAQPLLFIGYDYTGTHPTGPAEELTAREGAYADAGVSMVLAPAGVVLPPDSVEVFRDAGYVVARIPHARPPVSVASGGPCTLRGSPTAFTADCAAPAVVRVNTLALPGWTASVAGHPVDVGVLRPDLPFQVVPVPAGTSAVRLSYLPPGELAGLGLAGCGALAAGALAAVRRRRAPAG